MASIFSDDHGDTWQRGEIVCRDGDHLGVIEIRNPSESAAVELSDGQVMFNIRNDSTPRRRLTAVSVDGASGWQVVEFDPALPEPACMGSMVRLSWDEGLQPERILFANPASLDNDLVLRGGLFAHDRVWLTVRLSEDNDMTWIRSKVLEEGPAGYSDLACLPDGTIFCLYECGMVDHMLDPRSLRLARFDLDWIGKS